MDIPNDSIIERTTLRYIDPITGERYHMLYNPPPTQEVRERLRKKATDTDEIVKAKISEFYSSIRYIHDYYEPILQHINADQEPSTVFELIESGVVNPIPKIQQEWNFLKF